MVLTSLSLTIVQDPRMGPTVLVLAPTRELAVQIKEEADKFGKSSGIRNT
jgi:ATP-dependent RNA helicase DDX5/DBP2